MRRTRTSIRATLVLLVLAAATARADEFSDATDLFRAAGASQVYFDHAYGYAVFPTIGKAAVGIGGAYGKGRVYVGNQAMGSATMTQLSVGFQLGGQAYTQIIFLQDRRAFDEFTSGNFEFGATASAVAITAGASATAGTTGGSAGASGGRKDATTVGEGYYKGTAVFVIAKGGLMFEASIGGQKFSYQPF